MEAIFLRLLNMSISASYLVAAVIVLRLLLRRAPKALRCALWLLVGLRLLLPVSIESVMSLIPSAETVPEEIVYAPMPAIDSGIGAVNSAVNPVLQHSFAPETGDSVNPLQIVTALASRIWVCGMAVLALYALVSCLLLRRRMRTAVHLEGNVWQSEAADSPFVFGLLRPRIYLPFRLSGEERESVLAHERAHIARRDHWWKPLGYLLLTVYWFNPLLWLAYILLCRDIELACDEKVVRDMDVQQRKAYSAALLNCSASHSRLAACPLAFGEVGVKERIQSVLHYKKPAFWLILAGALALLVLAVCFLTNPKKVDFGLESNPITDTFVFDMRGSEDPRSGSLGGAEIGELTKRLSALRGLKRGDPYGGLTPYYSLSAILSDGRRVFLRGYNTDGHMTDLLWEGETYRVTDVAFEEYISALCDLSGTETVSRTGSEGLYEMDQWLYTNPLSSTFHRSAFTCAIGTDSFSLTDESGETVYAVSGLTEDWQMLTQERLEGLMHPDGVGLNFFNIHVADYAVPRIRSLRGAYTLLDMDGTYWLKEGWHLYSLRPVGSETAASQESYGYLDEIAELFTPLDNLDSRLAIWQDYWSAVNAGEDGTVPMLLRDVRRLAEQETITWEELRRYQTTPDLIVDGEIYNSALIRSYPVGQDFFLEITEVGIHTDIVRGVIQLSHAPSGDYATFGEDDIGAFIDAHSFSADEALSEAVESALRSGWWDGRAHPAIDVDAGAFYPLGMTVDGDTSQATYYGFALYRGYKVQSDSDNQSDYDGRALECVWEFCTYAAVTLGMAEPYETADFWVPGDGAAHDRDIAAKFPKELADAVLQDPDPSATVAGYRAYLGQRCDRRAAAKQPVNAEESAATGDPTALQFFVQRYMEEHFAELPLYDVLRDGGVSLFSDYDGSAEQIVRGRIDSPDGIVHTMGLSNDIYYWRDDSGAATAQEAAAALTDLMIRGFQALPETQRSFTITRYAVPEQSLAGRSDCVREFAGNCFAAFGPLKGAEQEAAVEDYLRLVLLEQTVADGLGESGSNAALGENMWLFTPRFAMAYDGEDGIRGTMELAARSQYADAGDGMVWNYNQGSEVIYRFLLIRNGSVWRMQRLMNVGLT